VKVQGDSRVTRANMPKEVDLVAKSSDINDIKLENTLMYAQKMFEMDGFTLSSGAPTKVEVTQQLEKPLLGKSYFGNLNPYVHVLTFTAKNKSKVLWILKLSATSEEEVDPTLLKLMMLSGIGEMGKSHSEGNSKGAYDNDPRLKDF